MTIREALAKSGNEGEFLTKEIVNFLVDMVDELRCSMGNLSTTLAVPKESRSDSEADLVRRFEAFEKRWNEVIAKLDRVPTEPEPPKQLVLNELGIAKMEAIFWKREALRAQEARAVDAVKRVREELLGVENYFQITAGYHMIDTTRNFSWDDKTGVVTYEEPTNTSPRVPHKR